jgi:hypothetical protein
VPAVVGSKRQAAEALVLPRAAHTLAEHHLVAEVQTHAAGAHRTPRVTAAGGTLLVDHQTLPVDDPRRATTVAVVAAEAAALRCAEVPPCAPVATEAAPGSESAALVRRHRHP